LHSESISMTNMAPIVCKTIVPGESVLEDDSKDQGVLLLVGLIDLLGNVMYEVLHTCFALFSASGIYI